MFDPDQDGDPLTDALSSRRIPHAHSRNKQRGGGARGNGKGGSSTTFNPLHALGHYDVQLGSSSKHVQKRKGEGKSPSLTWLEIHELTEGEDGLIGSFKFCDGVGSVEGLCVLAGSRKGLAGIVDELEQESSEDEDEEDEEDEEEEEEEDDDDQNDETTSQVEVNTGNEDIHDVHDGGQAHSPSPPHQSALEAADEKLNRRFHAFEKNTFRNPKFWLRWKGHVQVTAQPQPQTHTDAESQPTDPTTANNTTDNNTTEPLLETNLGYIVFSSNDCDRFEGTVTCTGLGWDNLKLQGWKTRSRGTACPVRWMDL